MATGAIIAGIVITCVISVIVFLVKIADVKRPPSEDAADDIMRW